MKLDITTNVNQFLDKDVIKKYGDRKDEVFNLLDSASMNGWLHPDLTYIHKILEVRDRVKKNSQCLVVVGIGGSFLGSAALYEMFKPYFKRDKFEIIYAGTTLSSSYMSELVTYLKTVDFSVNVISKSGITMETSLTYAAIKKVMEEKYSHQELKERIIITTDPVKGNLRKEVEEVGYTAFEIPDNIGGRYSLLTAAHLFPLSFYIDINELISGYREGILLKELAFSYAVVRRSLFDSRKVVENFVTYENNFYYYLEWLKQLFGETEGKESKGILPISMIHTRDLHSLGQFVQEGNKILYETFFKIKNNREDFFINDRSLHQDNLIVEDSVIAAHVSGGVPCIILELDDVSPYTIGEVSAFFLLTAAFSGFLFDVDPFNQPGVEVYKSEVRSRL